jgi:hypothetical protein
MPYCEECNVRGPSYSDDGTMSEQRWANQGLSSFVKLMRVSGTTGSSRQVPAQLRFAYKRTSVARSPRTMWDRVKERDFRSRQGRQPLPLTWEADGIAQCQSCTSRINNIYINCFASVHNNDNSTSRLTNGYTLLTPY